LTPEKTKNVYYSEPKVVEQLQQSYEQWWKSVLPLMVNEGLPTVEPEEQPLAKRYYKQLEEFGIPDWTPNDINE
jgi:arylsulfatase